MAHAKEKLRPVITEESVEPAIVEPPESGLAVLPGGKNSGVGPMQPDPKGGGSLSNDRDRILSEKNDADEGPGDPSSAPDPESPAMEPSQGIPIDTGGVGTVRSGIRFGVAAKVILLAVAPVVVMFAVNLFITDRMSMLFETVTTQHAAVTDRADELQASTDSIKVAMAELLSSVSATVQNHQTSLLSQDPGQIGTTLDLRSEVEAKIIAFAASIPVFREYLVDQGMLVLEGPEGAEEFVDPAAVAAEEQRVQNVQQAGLLLRSANSLPRLFAKWVESNDQSTGLMRDGNYVDAANIFIFTEVKQIAPVADTVTRMATVLDQLVATVSQNERQAADVNAAMLAADMDSVSKLSMAILIAVAAALAVAAVAYSYLGLSRPLKRLSSTMAGLSSGDTDTEIPPAGRDEIGDMTRAVGVFKENAIENVRLQEEERQAAEQRRALEDEARRLEFERLEEERRTTEERSAHQEEARRLEREREEERKLADQKTAKMEAERREAEVLADQKTAKLEAERRDSEMRQAEEARARDAADLAAREARQTNIDSLTAEFGESVTEVLETVLKSAKDLEGTAESLNRTAEQTQDESITVASAAEEATSNVQTVASAAEELASSIGEINRQVSRSSDIAKEAVAAAEDTNHTISELAVSAQQVGDVISMINGIAEQTNLLALNATIEAARAGESGKGFAVVASEVKNLANQTGDATKQIAAQIEAIQGTTRDAVSAIKRISATITEMNEIAGEISSAIAQQEDATTEISRNVQEAAVGTRDVSKSIIKVTAASEDTGTASTGVLGAARTLSERFAILQEEVEQFLTAIKQT